MDPTLDNLTFIRRGFLTGQANLPPPVIDPREGNAIKLSRVSVSVAALLLAMAAPITSLRAQGLRSLTASRVAGGFSSPVFATAPPGDTARLFVVQQSGQIRIVDLPSGSIKPTAYLDISSEIVFGGEQGLLGLAFDPNYAANGRFYLNYTAPGGSFGAGVTHIAQFTVSTNPDVADPASERTVLQFDQPQTNHNGGWIGFSPRSGDTGNLYIATGDGGNANDAGPGHIEPGGSTTARQEIWAFGLRNPYRDSFDRQTGTMFIGDVGQDTREEVDAQSPANPGGGENYGWRVREGFVQNPAYPTDPVPPDALDPIYDYTHAVGQTVIGGYVYRGNQIQVLRGFYVFADYLGPEGGPGTGRVFVFRYNGRAVSGLRDITTQLFPTPQGGFPLNNPSSLGEDASGELYITDIENGNLYKLTAR